MNEEDTGFKVKDRRRFAEDGSMREPEETRDEKPERQAEPGPEDKAEPEREEPAGEQSQDGRFLPPVDFSTFILSMSHAVMLHMGQVPDPGSGQTHKDMELARHTIDTIAMLQQKTKGNLDPDEQGLIDNILAELRLAYVRLNQ